MQTEFKECFLKCDKDSRVVMAIPLEHLGKAMRLCGLTPPEKLVQTIQERLEKQQPLITPPPSDDEEEGEEDEIVLTEEEKEIQAHLDAGLSAAEIIHKRRRRKSSRHSKKRKSGVEAQHEQQEKHEAEEAERQREEAERRAAAEAAAREEEEEKRRKEEEEKEKAAKEANKSKRQLTWPHYHKKEDLKMLAKMKNRFKHFITWDEFQEVLWAYAFQTQYDGQQILWAFRTLDPKLDYELEPVWPYGADEPLIPTDEISNLLCADFLEGKQERFLTKETKRFLKMADFKKEGFFDFKQFVEDYCQEANYDFGVAEKKKKLKLKET